VNPNDAPGFKVELSEDMGYYFELKYFVQALLNNQSVTTADPLSTMGSIEIIEAEIESADQLGIWVNVK
jgi:hypothetical protein